jgi:hypothetical protein
MNSELNKLLLVKHHSIIVVVLDINELLIIANQLRLVCSWSTLWWMLHLHLNQWSSMTSHRLAWLSLSTFSLLLVLSTFLVTAILFINLNSLLRILLESTGANISYRLGSLTRVRTYISYVQLINLIVWIVCKFVI